MQATPLWPLVVFTFLTACTYEPLTWTHRTLGAADYERDSAYCRNEAAHAGANYNAIVTLCMQVRGWYQVQANPRPKDQATPVPFVRPARARPTAPLPPTGEPSAPDVPAPPLAIDKPGGRWGYAAERAAAFYFPSCERPRAYLTITSVRTEFFEVVCASGRSVEMQCDYAECAPS